jgi:hypothetical protein
MGSFSLGHWILIIAIAYIFYAAMKSLYGTEGKIYPEGPMICPNCGSRGEPKTNTRGSIAIEILLWLCLLIPGLIYSIWRSTTKYKACPSCGNVGMISVESPNGKALLKTIQAQDEKIAGD